MHGLRCFHPIHIQSISKWKNFCAKNTFHFCPCLASFCQNSSFPTFYTFFCTEMVFYKLFSCLLLYLRWFMCNVIIICFGVSLHPACRHRKHGCTMKDARSCQTTRYPVLMRAHMIGGRYVTPARLALTIVPPAFRSQGRSHVQRKFKSKLKFCWQGDEAPFAPWNGKASKQEQCVRLGSVALGVALPLSHVPYLLGRSFNARRHSVRRSHRDTHAHARAQRRG